jgi:hypothetical protein
MTAPIGEISKITLFHHLSELYIGGRNWNTYEVQEQVKSTMIKRLKEPALVANLIDADNENIEVLSHGEELNSQKTDLAELKDNWNAIASIKYVPESIDAVTLSIIWNGLIFTDYELFKNDFSTKFQNNIEEMEDVLNEIPADMNILNLDFCDQRGQSLYSSKVNVMSNESDHIYLCNNLNGEDDTYSLIIRMEIEISNVPWVPMKAYLKSTGNPYKFSHHIFESTFSELVVFMDNMNTSDFLTLDEIKSMLDYVANLTGDKVSIFGLTVLQSTVALLGPIVLTFIQLYFALHFYEVRRYFEKKEDKKVTVPWIVLYQKGWISKQASLITLLVLPVTACSIPVFLQWYKFSNIELLIQIFYLFILTISISIAYWTYAINQSFKVWEFHFELD